MLLSCQIVNLRVRIEIAKTTLENAVDPAIREGLEFVVRVREAELERLKAELAYMEKHRP
jgi:hypothetical protein